MLAQLNRAVESRTNRGLATYVHPAAPTAFLRDITKMPRAGRHHIRGSPGKLDVLRVACRKCDRTGRYQVAELIVR